jgi:NCS1 family nucleobase:cation symporter-1
MLDHDFSHGRRAGIAIINLVFIFGNALIELGANVIPFGADFMSLFPRWLNIKRGMWMSYILGVCICPWQILATATGFLEFLNGYSIYLGPFLGMALTDYLVVRKGNVFVPDLYQVGGRYWYFHGVAWRPIVTWLCSVVFMVCYWLLPLWLFHHGSSTHTLFHRLHHDLLHMLLLTNPRQLPGFAETFGSHIASGGGWTHLYAFSWFYTCTISSCLYFALSFIGGYAGEEKAMSFESLAGLQRTEELEAVEPEMEVSEVNLPVEQKV